MAKPLRHRQTKEAATDMFDLKPLRHTSTLPTAVFKRCLRHVRYHPNSDARADIPLLRICANLRHQWEVSLGIGLFTASPN
jgi:hypothetical protein